MGGLPVPRRRPAWWLIVVGVLAVGIIAVPVSIPIVNDAAASDVEKRLTDLPVPKGAERIDSMSQAGRIVGNGNGMQYVGALLIRSGDGVAELQRFYGAQEATADLPITVAPADGLEREGFHGAHGFLDRSGERGTFVVYAWGKAPGAIFEDSDLRGH